MEIQDNVQDNLEEGEVTAQASYDEGEGGATRSYGKFSSPDALYKSYKELEAKFTQNCQRLKKLEEQLKNLGTSEAGENTGAAAVEPLKENKSSVTEEERKNIINEYLSSVAERKIPLMRGDGVSVAAKKQKPTSLNEAGLLALQYFKQSLED